ncbi:uncharacterized protein LOC114673869 [Macaca mulatta]
MVPSTQGAFQGQWFSTGRCCTPEDILGCHKRGGGATGTQQVEARDVANEPPTHRQPRSQQVEKPPLPTSPAAPRRVPAHTSHGERTSGGADPRRCPRRSGPDSSPIPGARPRECDPGDTEPLQPRSDPVY